MEPGLSIGRYWTFNYLVDRFYEDLINKSSTVGT